MTVPRLLHAFLLYLLPRCMSRKIKTSPNDIRVVCFPFKQVKHWACAGESLGFVCTYTSVPAYVFLPLHKNPVIFPYPKFPNFMPVTSQSCLISSQFWNEQTKAMPPITCARMTHFSHCSLVTLKWGHNTSHYVCIAEIV